MRFVNRWSIILLLIILLTLCWGFDILQLLNLPNFINVGLGFFLFLIPGGTVGYMLSGGQHWSWVRFVGFGLPISIGLVGMMGLLARTLNLTIHHISAVWYVLSILGIIGVGWRIQLTDMRNIRITPQTRITLLLASVAVFVVLVFTLSAPITMIKRNDILLHNAEITRHASGMPLDWNEIYFDSGQRISDRISVAYWRFGEALIVDVSGEHILVAQLTISALLMVYLGCSIYVSVRLFNYSIRTSLIITILHFVILALLTQADRQSGGEVLRRLIQDKVLAGFGFAPIILGISYHIRQSPHWRKYTLLALVIIGTIFTHPILAGFVVGVIGLWMVFNVLLSRKLRPYINIAILCAVIFSPMIVVRFTTEMEFNFGDDKITEDERIWLDESGELYSASPEIVGNLTYALLFAVIVMSLAQLLRTDNDRLHLAYVLVVVVALIPQVAWIYGRLVSVYHIYRVIWIIPYGLALWYLLESMAKIIENRLSDSIQMWGQRIFLTAAIVVSPLIVLSGVSTQLDNVDRTLNLISFQRELVDVAEFMEGETSERVVVMGDSNIRFRDYLGTISHLLKPVSFCEERCMMNFTGIDYEDAKQRLSRNQRFFSDEHDPATKVLNLDRYDVNYIIYQRDISQSYIDELYTEYSEQFEEVFKTKSVAVIRYTPKTESE